MQQALQHRETLTPRDHGLASVAVYG
jgi:hypothetical protein